MDKDEAGEIDEILADLEKQAANICYHDKTATFVEQKLANVLACLIAVVRAERRKAKKE